MSPGLAVFILMNNYFHDVATAMLLASGLAMWAVIKNLDNNREEKVVEYFIDMYRSVARLAKFSLYWILIGGIPRILAFKDFEWANAVGKKQVSGLIVKHVIAFVFVSGGVYLWLRLGRRIKEITAGRRIG